MLELHGIESGELPAICIRNYMELHGRGNYMSGTKPSTGTPKDGRLAGRGAKPGPKKGSHNKPKGK